MENHLQHHPSHSARQLSNQELLSRTKLLVQKERDIHIQVLRHLAEIDSRKLFFQKGFSSLFDYAVRELGYSEGAAYRRIKAMKLCRDLPETANRLQSGRLSLSVASQLQIFFEKQNKKAKQEMKKKLSFPEGRVSENEVKELEKSGEDQILIKPPVQEILKREKTEENLKMRDDFQSEDLNRNLSSFKPLNQKEKENLVQRAQGCSTRAAEKLLSETDPSLSCLKREQVRFLGKGKLEIKVVIDEQCHKELEKLKNLLSHRNPALSYGELISILSKEALKKHDPKEKIIRQKKEEEIQKNTSLRKQEFKGGSTALVTAASSRRQKLTDKSTGLDTSAPKSEYGFKKISRYIPSRLKKYIWERDGGQCTYFHHETKRRCTSQHLLQIDHIQPFALGGKTEKENLRLLCAGHNQYRR